jgi:hypothetical protein
LPITFYFEVLYFEVLRSTSSRFDAARASDRRPHDYVITATTDGGLCLCCVGSDSI